MTKFSGTFSGHADGDDWKVPVAIGTVVAAGFIAYEAAKAAAGVLGDLLVIVPVALGSLAVGAVVTYVALRARRRHPAAADRHVTALWQANPHALPPRETRAITAAPVVNVNIDAGLLAGLLRAAQEQQPAPVIVQPETQELPR